MTQSLHVIVWYLFIIWLQNLLCAMHVYLTSTSSMCKTQWHAIQCLSYSSWSHVGTWHMWRHCRDILVWSDHSDVLLVPEECTRPPWAILSVHARSEDVHARTHSLARTRGYTGGRNFVPRSTPCDNLTRVHFIDGQLIQCMQIEWTWGPKKDITTPLHASE